jgi:NitT/TauT family transport system substrate-binding protein
MQIIQNRRDFLASASSAAAASVFGARTSLADEGPPETNTIRLLRDPGCGAPTTLAEELMRAEGFSDVRYADLETGVTDVQLLMRGSTDIGVAFATDVVRELNAGTPVTVLAGMHSGCQELFAHPPVDNIKDLKGRSVALPRFDYAAQLLLSVMLSYIGLDPATDIDWITSSSSSPMELFAAGKADAYFAIPPEGQELRARKVGKVILKTATDRPWSQYLCCVLISRRAYVQSYPVATKRALRAILKATDMCAADPERAAQRLVESASTARYDFTLEMISGLPYAMWREYDPEDTLRFYALRLRELGMINSTPNKIIAEGADWRFLKEIKRELKA